MAQTGNTSQNNNQSSSSITNSPSSNISTSSSSSSGSGSLMLPHSLVNEHNGPAQSGSQFQHHHTNMPSQHQHLHNQQHTQQSNQQINLNMNNLGADLNHSFANNIVGNHAPFPGFMGYNSFLSNSLTNHHVSGGSPIIGSNLSSLSSLVQYNSSVNTASNASYSTNSSSSSTSSSGSAPTTSSPLSNTDHRTSSIATLRLKAREHSVALGSI